MNHDAYSEDYIGGILERVKTIALVGASNNELRPSHSVMKFLISKGYEVFPVNPRLAGQSLHGQLVYAALTDIPRPVDMIDIFRNSAAAGGVVDEALGLAKKPSVIWMQLGVRDGAAAARAEAQGVKVVMNRCPAIELLKRER